MSTIASISETKRQYSNIPLTAYDAGWILLCIGMAIGAGTVLVPVQIGLKAFGFSSFLF